LARARLLPGLGLVSSGRLRPRAPRPPQADLTPSTAGTQVDRPTLSRPRLAPVARAAATLVARMRRVDAKLHKTSTPAPPRHLTR
jgi:hypothetical protein